MPEKYAVNHIDKHSSEDFINCEFYLAESLKMQKKGWQFGKNQILSKNLGKHFHFVHKTCFNR